MHRFYAPDITTTMLLPDEEAQHCVRVLRLKEGEEVEVVDGKGHLHLCRILNANAKNCAVEIVGTTDVKPHWGCRITVAIAPTKNMDRMEWLAEKATEIGFDELTFLNCRFSERKVIKTERVEKIVVSAVKQSLKARKPVVNEMTDFRRFMEREFTGQKFIAHCYEGEKPLLRDVLRKDEDAVVLIGPEGDFSPEEVALAAEKGFQAVSLGKSRLRTETAALVAVHLMNLTHAE